MGPKVNRACLKMHSCFKYGNVLLCLPGVLEGFCWQACNSSMCPSCFPVEIQSRAMSSQKRTGRQPSGPLCLCWDPCNLLGVSLADYRALCSPLKAVSRTFLLTDFPSVVVKEPRIQAFTYCFFSCCKFLRVTQFLAPSSSLLQAQA